MPRAATANLVVTRLDSLEEARPTWGYLAERQDNIFSTWEWAATWWRHYGACRELFLHEVTDGNGRPIAILPLYVASKSVLRVMRFVGHGPADQLGPVCAPEDRDVVAAVLRGLTERRRSPGVLLAERLRGDKSHVDALGGRLIRQESFPLIALNGLSWEEWLATKSSNFRQQAGRRERRLARNHRVEYRLVTGEDEIGEALDTLIELHEAHWQGRSSAFTPSRRTFHHEFARAACRRDWLRVWIASVDGEPAAAWLGYRFGGADSYYQMGRSPAWDSHNIGFLLLMRTIRDAAEAKSGEYRLLLGNEPYKHRLATEDPGLVTCVAGTGLMPLAIGSLMQHRRRLPRFARKAVTARLDW